MTLYEGLMDIKEWEITYQLQDNNFPLGRVRKNMRLENFDFYL